MLVGELPGPAVALTHVKVDEERHPAQLKRFLWRT
jgi:hypothetical protein